MAQQTVVMPSGANTEPAATTVPAESGFLISVDGAPVAGDPRMADIVRRSDVALARADVRVRFDGLEVKPRLNVVMMNRVPPRPGETVTVHSELNYPAYVTRAEMRVIDRAARGGARTLAVFPAEPNSATSFHLPEGKDLVVVHRVYDAQGRYDETQPLPLRASDRAGLGREYSDPPEDGIDTAARRRIPVYGGAVTVSGSDVRQGAVVKTLGETIRPDASGNFVVQRILPAGDRAVVVQVQGAGENTYIERDISIPRSEWFGTGIIDLTYGRRFSGGVSNPVGDYTVGRIAGYAKGKTQNGWTLTGSIDTGEGEMSQMFRELDKKDPYNVLLRMQRENAYPTYGDDSTIEDGAPTDGKIYLKAEKNGNHVVWGNYKSSVSGGYYLRNERTLYGAQGAYRSAAQTSRGQARVALEVYAASPDNLPARDTFRGTGGSLYFFQRQDIRTGSDTITVELRDPDTGRVVDTRRLIAGRDYTINYVQGSVALSAPLSSQSGSGVVSTRPGGEYDVYLVAAYEYTPTAGQVSGYSYGGRAETWLGDRLRFGYTGIVEQTDIADQTAQSVDLRFEHSEATYLDLEYAQTRGPGFGSSVSSNGGLIITNMASAGTSAGTGTAWMARGQVDLADMGSRTPGTLGAYFENRGAGFSTLDYQTTTAEKLWGFSADVQASEQLGLRLYYDDYENTAGRARREGGVELRYTPSEKLHVDIGVEHLEKTTPGGLPKDNGSRTDVAARLTMMPSDGLEYYVFGQATVQRRGGIAENNRLGVGATYRFAKNWTAEAELSDGSLGLAGQAILTHQTDGYDSTYFGYRLTPGRDFSGVTLNGRDQGQFVVGAKRRVSDDVDVYGENTYDMFGTHKSLTSAYGVKYRASEQLTFHAALEVGKIRDPGGDFDRRGVSLGLRYADTDRLTAKAKLELRRDRGVIAGTNSDSTAILLAGSVDYKIDDAQRLVFRAEYANTKTDNSSILSGTYADASLGYALRPVLDDRVNLLFKYRFLYDMIGQQIDGVATRGPRQESHVASLDVDYDLNQKWTLGGKIGGRVTRSSPSTGVAFAQNNAWLGVLNARYHVTHKWDLLLEGRYLEAQQAGTGEFGVLAAGYRSIGNNLKLGVGYNFGRFSDDLTDLVHDDEGVFINLIAKF